MFFQRGTTFQLRSVDNRTRGRLKRTAVLTLLEPKGCSKSRSSARRTKRSVRKEGLQGTCVLLRSGPAFFLRTLCPHTLHSASACGKPLGAITPSPVLTAVLATLEPNGYSKDKKKRPKGQKKRPKGRPFKVPTFSYVLALRFSYVPVARVVFCNTRAAS